MDFDELLTLSAGRDASDVHLKPGAHPILRVHGALEHQQDWPVVTQEYMLDLAKRLVKPQRLTALLEEGREMDLAYELKGSTRFRVNLFLAKGEINGSLRAIPRKIPAFEELHLPKILEKLSMERRGMVLVTGVTGSGKSTTLAAMIDYMNRYRNDHIITIEDPIEFIHEDKNCVIRQREMGQDSGGFAQALRAALREDPDVILVGEMRDPETMSTALHAAETGHLVLSTLHTLNAAETVNRIVGGIPPHHEELIRSQLSGVMTGIVSQRLLVKADGKGRIPAVEVMVGTGLIRDCIRDREKTPQIPAVIAAGQAQYGMQTFDQSLLALYRDDLISLETAMEAATNADDFALKIRGILSAAEMTWEVGAGDPGKPAARPAAPEAPTAGGSTFFKKEK
ncbi:MAG: type IV pilus twitching motility protein PilT [Candidatus Rokubacteria bacterium]|nr:type IV pilus twitching motility protein PilT [Candidatus Rokubacteria bacterium]